MLRKTLKLGDKVVNQHGFKGIIVEARPYADAPLQVLSPSTGYRIFINYDGRSTHSDMVWRRIEEIDYGLEHDLPAWVSKARGDRIKTQQTRNEFSFFSLQEKTQERLEDALEIAYNAMNIARREYGCVETVDCAIELIEDLGKD